MKKRQMRLLIELMDAMIQKHSFSRPKEPDYSLQQSHLNRVNHIKEKLYATCEPDHPCEVDLEGYVGATAKPSKDD